MIWRNSKSLLGFGESAKRFRNGINSTTRISWFSTSLMRSIMIQITLIKNKFSMSSFLRWLRMRIIGLKAKSGGLKQRLTRMVFLGSSWKYACLKEVSLFSKYIVWPRFGTQIFQRRTGSCVMTFCVRLIGFKVFRWGQLCCSSKGYSPTRIFQIL